MSACRSPFPKQSATPGFGLLAAVLLCAAMTAFAALPAPAGAQDLDAEAVPERVLFVLSGGRWADSSIAPEDSEQSTAVEDPPAEGDDAPDAAETEAQSEKDAAESSQRGYYRLVVLRSADNTSRVHLQQVALTPDGPQVLQTRAIAAINDLGAYVTDVRQEDGGGSAGFSTFVNLKIDPGAGEAETWAVFVDEFGEVAVEQATN
ncbi:hypothetical protein [Pseudohoeflea coraliihabitans]|uniref:Uncharacterized protein n=1 Tax=Pseudohoeflea coraliihabitans TaxID=2860393 RepID=A0ABS6WSM6_9HYPH|nr:hypothetical protein [Pseudohoeflea sp. DP4N28-3]MBW3098947.1 hypothetical protein [Pseudohoeflea sp. DP4N28-3]